MSLYVRGRELRGALSGEMPLYILMYRENYLNVSDLNPSLPSSVASLLQDYQDVFPDEVPLGLPPIRDIEHQIDFILGAQIPNSPAYRSSLAETKKLQREVDELLAKGYIHKSMCPCAIPVLPVPKKDGTYRMCMDYSVVNKITMNKNIDEHLRYLKLVFDVMRKEKLYANVKKCSFCLEKIMFLGLIVSSKGVIVDDKKVKAIRDWPTLKNANEVGSFHGLGKEHEQAFAMLKEKLYSAPLLILPNFDKTLEIECDVSGVGIGAILLQEKHPIAYFSEKLYSATLNYSTNGKELYALVRALETWQHYLWPNEFVMHSDHKSLKAKKNVVADALSHKYNLFTSLDSKLLGFECVKELYEHDDDFAAIFHAYLLPLPIDYIASLDGEKKAEMAKKMHEQAKLHLERKNEQYASHANKGQKPTIFEPGDLVWVHLRKKRFPNQRKPKLHPRSDGPFQVLESINDNAYKIELPSDYGVVVLLR
ncbi:uncharacterized protein LOC131178358 [Hevea brasiliensis]|uniref:uncharacterized protein LOC131178358 n=1 Tax=Hevea brasiliensis TaxID=3981 RepID=UPI0025E1B965|nr:uncharacterized protein LOC131178358 [Hevea brasiliensis]